MKPRLVTTRFVRKDGRQYRLAHAGHTYRLFRLFGCGRLSAACAELSFLATGKSGSRRIRLPE